MQDPNPENIVGQKRVTHSVDHHIPWGQVAVGVGLLAVAYVGYKVFLSGSSGSDDTDDVGDEIEDAGGGFAGTEVPVSGGGLTA
jgi:hypothetical protein